MGRPSSQVDGFLFIKLRNIIFTIIYENSVGNTYEINDELGFFSHVIYKAITGNENISKIEISDKEGIDNNLVRHICYEYRIEYLEGIRYKKPLTIVSMTIKDYEAFKDEFARVKEKYL